MTSSNGNIFRVIGLLRVGGNSPVTCEFPSQRPVTRSFDLFFDLRLNNGWVNNREVGDWRRHYDVIVIEAIILFCVIYGDDIVESLIL